MNIKTGLLTGLIAYVAFLVATPPAGVVLSLLEDHLGEVRIEGVDGSLWSGRATRIHIESHTLDTVRWRLAPWYLLTGELVFHLEGDFRQQPVQTDAGFTLTGKVVAHPFEASLPADLLTTLFDIPLANLAGRLDARLDTLRWDPDGLPEIEGELHWNDAVISVAQSVALGDITIVLDRSDDDRQRAVIRNQGGELQVSGEARLDDERNVELQLDLKLQPGSQARLASSMEMFASKQGQGRYKVEYRGKLPL